MLELYHGEPNMFSLKPLIALHEKDLDFVGHYVDFPSFEHLALPVTKSGIEVRHNPEGDGPILVHRGMAMTKSFFIMLYLDEAYPETPLRADDPVARWRVLMWARFLNEVAAPAIGTLGCHKYLVPELKRRDRKAAANAISTITSREQQDGWRAALDNSYSEELLADSRRKAELSVKKVEGALADGDWLAGPGYSLADIDAFALLRPLAKMAPELLNDTNAPRTISWLARIEERAAVKAALAESKTGKPETSFTPGCEHSRWG